MLKKLFTLSLLTISLVIANAQDFKTAGEYNNYIINQQVEVTKKFLAYNSSIAQGKSARKVEKRRASLIKEVQAARENIQSIGFYQGDRTFRDASAAFLLMYYNVLNEDYGKIVNLEEIAEQSYDNMEAYMLAQEKADEKLEEANHKISLVQQEFAKKFNLTITKESDDEISNMSKNVSEINDYYHKVYLIFFKSYKQEAYLTDAINHANLNGIEQNKNSLLLFAKEGIAKLDTLKNFRGDASLKNACKQLLEFYVKECNEKMPMLTDYFLKKEKFENIKKEFQQMADIKKTKEEVAKYNGAVNDMNKAVGSYNDGNNYLNTNRTNYLNNWNTTTNSFMSTYTPKYK
jgi:hypothetical protein